MKQSTQTIPTQKDIAKNIESINAQLLIRAGYIQQMMAGIYAYYPLGLRVLNNIENIVRDEMTNTLHTEEILLPSLHSKQSWQTTDRWDTLDVLFKTQSQTGTEYALGPTHEEQVVPLMKNVIRSYKDLPRAVFQIQTKFRDELRAKSGLLRGREFLMKDLYSFHENKDDLDEFYEQVKVAYANIYKRCGLNAILTQAAGGTFSKYSHEYQVKSASGEDIVFCCYHCNHFAQNEEISNVKEGDPCPECGKPLTKEQTSEVGNIFKLQTKYSKPFQLQFTDRNAQKQEVIMGCYGIGISRLMGTIVEVHHDEHGIIWPQSVAPYHIHLLAIGKNENIMTEAEKLYQTLTNEYEVLFDDRDIQPGVKFQEADLLGLPLRLVISEKTLKEGSVELKKRHEPKESAVLTTIDEALTTIKNSLQ